MRPGEWGLLLVGLVLANLVLNAIGWPGAAFLVDLATVADIGRRQKR